MLAWWAFLPFAIQGIVTLVDEFYFHRKRGLPLWEIFGHPLDTLTVLICFLFIILADPNETNVKIYIALCFFSCLFITKDEFIHSVKCKPFENWLHSILFILHPIVFLSAGFFWKNQVYSIFLKAQLSIVFIFMLYQVLYWRIRGKNK